VTALRRERYVSEFLDPRRSFERVRIPLEVRWDPLTGQSSRLLPEGSIPPPRRQDLDQLAQQTRPNCPFCPDALEEQTPRFAEDLWPAGRICEGEAVLFPNLVPYAKWSAVSIYSAERHRLAIDEITPQLLADNLATEVLFAKAAIEHDPDSSWISINANHLAPSGSSIFHPHLQGAATPVPTTVQAILAGLEPDAVSDYIAAEQRDGERHIGARGRIEWLASFAPVGPAEIRAFVADTASPAELDRATIDELARGIAVVLRVYADLGFESFNLALIGAPPGTHGYSLCLRLIGRAYYGAATRSDAMWSERLHWEAAVDVAPERVAALARAEFTASVT
jgi:UDPglucose--hexose-1-phosphate uridylyltransferase